MKKDLYYSNLNNRPKKKAKNKKNKGPRLLSEEISSTYNLLFWTLAIMILVLGLSYLYVSSQKSARGYLLRELQLDYEDLTAESKELETQLIDAQSFKQIEETEIVDEMAEPENEEFSFVGDEENVARN